LEKISFDRKNFEAQNQKSNSANFMQRTYKVPASTYFGLGLFASGLAFLCLLTPLLFAYPKDSPTKILLVSITAIAIPIATICWLSRFKIIITPEALIYLSAFGRQQSVDLKDITNSKIIMRRFIFYQPLLEIESPKIKFTINFKVFSHEARKDLFHAVKA
jgi:hypothetical protein